MGGGQTLAGPEQRQNSPGCSNIYTASTDGSKRQQAPRKSSISPIAPPTMHYERAALF